MFQGQTKIRLQLRKHYQNLIYFASLETHKLLRKLLQDDPGKKEGNSGPPDVSRRFDSAFA